MYYRGAQSAIVVFDLTVNVIPIRFIEISPFEISSMNFPSFLSFPSFFLSIFFDFLRSLDGLKDTFARAKSWVKELQRQASPNIVIALVGNKLDLEQKRTVSTDDAQAYAEDNNLLYMETSAKSGINVNEIFVAIGFVSFIHLSLQERHIDLSVL